ncbi:MAG: hypothetical protein II052_05100 [Prevotella sp.]|nr:hypothetical protein [Prevotella sp.]
MNLPVDFEKYTRQLMGEQLYTELLNGLSEDVPVSIRVNPFKCPEHFSIPLKDECVPWCQYGYYLKHRPNFTFDPLFHAGLYYVQEASSMFHEHVIQQLIHEIGNDDLRVLDLCAAPGGKSIAIRSILPDNCLLYSNEPIRARAQVLMENMLKWGHPNVVVTNNYARDYQRANMRFDIIVADVPCSGEGMFRKDANAIGEWNLQNVEKCWRLQREIITDIWPCLKPGGYLVYSTCTFNAHENEENVNWIAEQLGADFVNVYTKEEWNITGSLIDQHPMYRFIPGKTRGEGLFVAVLKKHEDDAPNVHAREAMLRIMTDEQLVPPNKKKDIPNHSKALSIRLQRNEYPNVDIDYQQAISYLRKEAIVLPSETPRGIVLLTYQQAPIGFAKNIGNRANNLYPMEWRIKSTHIPEHETILEFAQPHLDGGHKED